MRVHRFFALLSSALALTMTSAHVLEMPQKLSYDLDLYTRVNGSLYLYFAIVGGTYQILSIILTATLAWRVRHERSGAWTLVAAACLALAFVSWLIIVEPVNLAIGHGASWEGLRMRWELGHLVGFVLSLAGFAALVVGTLRDLRVEREVVSGAPSLPAPGSRWRRVRGPVSIEGARPAS